MNIDEHIRNLRNIAEKLRGFTSKITYISTATKLGTKCMIKHRAFTHWSNIRIIEISYSSVLMKTLKTIEKSYILYN